MPHDRLDDLQVGLSFAKPCAERVPQMMCRKVRQQNYFPVLLLRFYFLARIVVCNDALDSAVHRLRIRNIAKAVAEDEAHHTINLHIVPARFFLLLMQHFKGILHGIKHRDRPNACFRFRL